MLDLAQLLRVPKVDTAFNIAPDGSRVAYSSDKSGEWQLYELILDSGDASPLTKSRGAKFSPRYSPSGSHLAFVVDFNGSESYHLFLKS